MKAAPWVVVSVVVGALWASVAGLPLFSESYTELALVHGFAGPGDAFDPALVPFRPLQHLAFWLFDRAGGDPAIGRAVTFALHAGSALLVFAIARALGASPRAAWCALALFLAFPMTKGLAWVAAISGPARTLCLLAIVWATVRHARRPTTALGLAIVALFVAALGFHQSAVIAALVFPLGLAALATGGAGQRAATAARALRHWPIVSFALVALGYVVYVGSLQARNYHAMVGPGAVAANAARASLAFAPEWVRLPALQGLRGASGGVGFAAGALAVSSVVGLLAVAVARGTAGMRWLLVVAALDLVLPALTTGFVGRYAEFAAALVAIAAGLHLQRVGDGGAARWHAAVLAVLGVSWAVDHAVDVREVRAAGALVERLLHDAAAARAAAPPGQRIALVDAPDHAGGDDDVPVFNWGLAEALARRGAGGPWLLLRVDACWTTSDHRQVGEAELAGLAADPQLTTLRYDATVGSFAPWRPR